MLCRSVVYSRLYLYPAPIEGLSLTYSVSQSIFSQWDAELRLLRHFNTLVFHYRRVIITNVFSNSSIYNDMSIGVYLVYLHSAPIEWLFANVFSNSKHSFTTIRSDQAMFTYNCICLQIERQSLTSSVAQSILSQCHFNTLIFQFFSPVDH